MNRRAFVTGLGAVLAAPLAEAQQAEAKVPRIGALWQGQPSAPTALRVTASLRQGLEQYGGYIDGKTVTLEHRYAELEQLPRAANDLVGLKVDVIVTGGTPAAIAAKRATAAIPIVGGALADPVADGLVASLSAPGGNVTGNTFIAPSLGPKRLQLLKEIVPTISRVAYFGIPMYTANARCKRC